MTSSDPKARRKTGGQRRVSILEVPLAVVFLGVAGLMMLVPVFHAVAVRDWLPARMFFYSSLLTLNLTVFLGIATYTRKPRSLARAHLVSLFFAFAVLPVVFALPFYEALRTTTFVNAYVEMVSSFTTTGMTFFEADRLPSTLHLWRAMVGWMGGYLTWLMAAAIMAPMNLGGFEVTSATQAGGGARFDRGGARPGQGDARERLLRLALQLLPVYATLTAILWTALVITGEVPFVALCHAMSVLATSGISPVGGLSGAQAGFAGELLIFAFLAFALSRNTFSPVSGNSRVQTLLNDPEVRIGTFFVILIPSLLFLRHWIGAYEVSEEADLDSALRALWGAIFSVLSFLSTAGFESAEWETARSWSGLQTPGLILAGLALVGGGVATTAGGVKLLRVYALYKHGIREMERLVYPSSVGGSGTMARQIRRKGAYIAWIFFMLFGLSFALVAVLLAATGSNFDEALALSVAALSTTGPVAQVALGVPIDLGLIDTAGRLVLAFAMVLGRMETLVIIALLNPAFWRS